MVVAVHFGLNMTLACGRISIFAGPLAQRNAADKPHRATKSWSSRIASSWHHLMFRAFAGFRDPRAETSET